MCDQEPQSQRGLTRCRERQELEDVTGELCNFGVVVCDGTPAVDPRLHDVIASCPPAQLAHQNATPTSSPMNHERSRLPGKAGKAIDIVTLSRFWKHASSTARETIQSVAGPSIGLLWSDCSRDERSGQDHHFQQAFLNRLSLPRVTPGSICALAPQSGARKGQRTALSTLSWCLQGCRRTYMCSPRDAPEFGGRSRDPRTARESSRRKEARMDVVVSRPGGLERWMIDVRTVDGKCATAIALGGTEGAFRSAEQEKQRRYKGMP